MSKAGGETCGRYLGAGQEERLCGETEAWGVWVMVSESNSAWISGSPSLVLPGNFLWLSLELSGITQGEGLGHGLTLMSPQTRVMIMLIRVIIISNNDSNYQ